MEIETRILNQAVKRNIERFPKDFMFQLSWEEAKRSRSQIVTSRQSKTNPCFSGSANNQLCLSAVGLQWPGQSKDLTPYTYRDRS